MDACCAVPDNECHMTTPHAPNPYCHDRASSSDWLFGLWPGPPQRFEPTGADTRYQNVHADWWPIWGSGSDGSDLTIGHSGAPGGERGLCDQGTTYRGAYGEICGGEDNWGATDVEVWYPTHDAGPPWP